MTIGSRLDWLNKKVAECAERITALEQEAISLERWEREAEEIQKYQKVSDDIGTILKDEETSQFKNSTRQHLDVLKIITELSVKVEQVVTNESEIRHYYALATMAQLDVPTIKRCRRVQQEFLEKFETLYPSQKNLVLHSMDSAIRLHERNAGISSEPTILRVSPKKHLPRTKSE